MDTICGYCERSADHTVGPFTVCDSPNCTRLAARDDRQLNPPTLRELLDRRTRTRP